MEWAQVLVIILSVFLAIFLLLGIILVILLIKVTVQIKRVTGSAQRTAENIESAVGRMAKASGPLMMIKTIVKQVSKMRKK